MILKQIDIHLTIYFMNSVFIKIPFVLNLASINPEISKRSIEFIQNSIELSSEVGSEFYAVHSGFLVDPDINELGKTIKQNNIVSRSSAMELFKSRVLELSDFASERNVRLLVENNVLSKNNFHHNNGNMLLLVDPEEIVNFMNEMGGKVGLLLDVGHLKVSSKTLGFDLIKSITLLNDITEGYHLSENSGDSDDHKIFDNTAWFLEHIDKSKSFSTLEINDSSYSEILKLSNWISQFLVVNNA